MASEVQLGKYGYGVPILNLIFKHVRHKPGRPWWVCEHFWMCKTGSVYLILSRAQTTVSGWFFKTDLSLPTIGEELWSSAQIIWFCEMCIKLYCSEWSTIIFKQKRNSLQFLLMYMMQPEFETPALWTRLYQIVWVKHRHQPDQISPSISSPSEYWPLLAVRLPELTATVSVSNKSCYASSRKLCKSMHLPQSAFSLS